MSVRRGVRGTEVRGWRREQTGRCALGGHESKQRYHDGQRIDGCRDVLPWCDRCSLCAAARPFDGVSARQWQLEQRDLVVRFHTHGDFLGSRGPVKNGDALTAQAFAKHAGRLAVPWVTAAVQLVHGPDIAEHELFNRVHDHTPLRICRLPVYLDIIPLRRRESAFAAGACDHAHQGRRTEVHLASDQGFGRWVRPGLRAPDADIGVHWACIGDFIVCIRGVDVIPAPGRHTCPLPDVMCGRGVSSIGDESAVAEGREWHAVTAAGGGCDGES